MALYIIKATENPEAFRQRLRYMICHTLHAFRVQFSHVRVFFDSRNVQKSVTKSDTSGHCLEAFKRLMPQRLAKPDIRVLT